ncbi:response regulator [Desulfosediminicola flagellatus]|uniref:response regulator n=1 Tax=Desulfosediminicola flagellatus TaxID=2569541 RepID=UPI0010AC25FA|nr:response regulator [Desulfosediminicola flagellatus]
MAGNDTILIVEDARELAGLLSDYLVQAGFQTHCLHDGTNVVGWVQENTPRLVLLDLMLPGRDGVEICKSIREFSDLPIIMITARVEEQDRLTGLDVGADDYICKPFSPREVVARVKAVLRRATNGFDREQSHNDFLQLDKDKLQATLKGHILTLTVVEFHLLSLLAEQPGRVFSRSQLIEKIYPDQRVVSDRTVDSHVKKLRKKMSEVHDGEIIHSIYSAGYKYEVT